MAENKVAYIFPGQGSQKVGMGRDLYDTFASVKAVFKEADDTLQSPLTKLIFEGPEEELRQTKNAQPALVVVSIACLRAIGELTNGKGLPVPAYFAGHSLGEYSAICAAGSLDFMHTVYLARERGRLMWSAGMLKPGGMAAVLGLDEAPLTEICQQTNTWIANYNCPGQLVISGAKEDVAKASELAKTKGALRVMPLPVSGAFHTPLMQSAADGLAQIVNMITYSKPSAPVVANTTAKPIDSNAAIREELLQQLCHGVQWQRSIEYMTAQGVDTFVEIGAGSVLTGMVKRIIKDAKTVNIGDLASVKEAAAAIK